MMIIHDEDVENQQPSSHPMPPTILPQAFLHAPNTFKPVTHIGAMNNTSSTLLNFKNVVYSMRSCPKTQALIFQCFLPLYFRTLSQNPRFTSKSFLPLYFRALSQNPSFISKSFFTIIFPYLVPKSKLYL